MPRSRSQLLLVAALVSSGCGKPDSGAVPAGQASDITAETTSGTLLGYSWSTNIQPDGGAYQTTIVTSNGSPVATVTAASNASSGPCTATVNDVSFGQFNADFPCPWSLPLPFDTAYGQASVIVAIAAHNAKSGQTTFDNQGCDDMPEELTNECGECCDVHDECYWTWGCDYESWVGFESPSCHECNDNVTSCVLNCIWNGGGQPSSCTYYEGACGQAWTYCDDTSKPCNGQCMQPVLNDAGYTECQIKQCPQDAGTDSGGGGAKDAAVPSDGGAPPAQDASVPDVVVDVRAGG